MGVGGGGLKRGGEVRATAIVYNRHIYIRLRVIYVDTISTKS